MTAEVVAAAAERLAEAGVDSPVWDAEQIAAHVLGVPRSRLHGAFPLDDRQRERFEATVARRAERVPLQYLVGSVGFRYVEVKVGRGVFIPRPETEVMAGWAVERMRERARPVLVDLCTGSGAIALALTHELPDAEVHAVELSRDALDWARRNLDGTRVGLHHGDAELALPTLSGRCDLVVSNPPYVPEAELALVQPEIRQHEPRFALVAGEDGLAVIRRVQRAAMRLLKPGGWFAVEHSDRQGESVPALLRDLGFADVEDHEDLTGRPRFTTGRRP